MIKNEDFTESDLVNRTLDEYKVRSNTVLQFIQDQGWLASVSPENTERKSVDISHVELSFLQEKYAKYCSDNRLNAVSNRTFNERIRKQFYVQTKCTKNATWVFCYKEINEDESNSEKKNK